MTRPFARYAVRLAVLGMVALACAGCGRKGSLDLPPGAALEAPPPPGTEPAVPAVTPGSNLPPPPRGQKKQLPMDVLLD